MQVIAWVGTATLVKYRYLSGSQSTWNTDCFCQLLFSKFFDHYFSKQELGCTICMLRWWQMIPEWWCFFLCSGPIVLFLLLNRFLIGEWGLFLLLNTKWIIWEAQIMMVLKGVWRLVSTFDVWMCFSVCSQQLWAQKPRVIEETGPSLEEVSAPFQVCFLCPCSSSGPVIQPASHQERWWVSLPLRIWSRMMLCCGWKWEYMCDTYTVANSFFKKISILKDVSEFQSF